MKGQHSRVGSKRPDLRVQEERPDSAARGVTCVSVVVTFNLSSAVVRRIPAYRALL
jgi:hypothetical protein